MEKTVCGGVSVSYYGNQLVVEYEGDQRECVCVCLVNVNVCVCFKCVLSACVVFVIRSAG